jgi:hypothetical protein
MEKETISDDAVVECAVCMKEIPRSAAKSAEAVDYVTYFCGLNCYQEWQKQQREEEE